MNKLLFAGTGIVVLVFGLFYYRQTQTKARAQAVEMESALQETEARAVTAEQRGDSFRQRLLQVEAENLSRREPAKPVVVTNMEQPAAKLFRDPQMRAAMKKQQDKAIQQSVKQIVSSNLVQQLGLTPEQGATLRELVKKKHAGDAELFMGLMSGQLSDTELAQLGRSVREQRDAADGEIRAFLGDRNYEGYAWQEDSMTERERLNEFRSKFTEAGVPLTSEQEDALLRAMYEERAATHFTHDFHNPHNFDMDHLPEIFSEGSLDQFISEMEGMNNRTIIRAQSMLGPEQGVEFAQALRDQFERSRMTVKMTATLFPVRRKN
ncbi:MAG TPA: hypothetical protein VK615_02815 [Candidatus Binatia bacterium]|nr:hypothetical protein [Candidatus Binatia bacterium]